MWKKIWNFIWNEDSILSWIVNIILAFVLIKFVVYPLLGLVLGTGYPIVAVVSGSMEHDSNFDSWWEENGQWYIDNDIGIEQFKDFHHKNGFNKGDIMILYGKKHDKIEAGDVIVFKSNRPDPIIHRVIKKWYDDEGYHYHTKGDNNADSISGPYMDETDIPEENVFGVAVIRIPLLGYIKIWFVELIGLFVGR